MLFYALNLFNKYALKTELLYVYSFAREFVLLFVVKPQPAYK